MKLRSSLILLQITLLLAVGFVSSAQSEIEDRITKAFDVNPGGKLTVNSARGTIEVTTTPTNQVNVEVIRQARTSSEKEAQRIFENFEITFRQSGNDVFIDTETLKERISFWDSGSNTLRVKFIISVPQKYNVDLNTAGGSISVADLDGSVQGRTSGGSLNFGKITGPVDGKTSGGSINLEGCDGDIDVHTSGGSIVIGAVKGEVLARTSGGSIKIAQAEANVDAKTSGGSINIEEVMGTVNASTSGGSVTARISKQPRASCSLKTSGGSVNVYLASGIGVNLDAQTSGGRVINDFPIKVQGVISKTSLEAKVNGGGPDLILRTSGGNINLKRL